LRWQLFKLPALARKAVILIYTTFETLHKYAEAFVPSVLCLTNMFIVSSSYNFVEQMILLVHIYPHAVLFCGKF